MGPVISLVTGRYPDSDAIVARVGAAARAGVDLIQVREPAVEGRALIALVTRCLHAVKGTSSRLLVNDRLDVALAAGAHGVHLRADSFALSRVRTMVPRGFLIGRSVHTLAEVAAAGLADYLIFGTVFPSTSKPGRVPEGLQALARVAAATSVPVLAIGGVTMARLPTLRATGAAGFAAISIFADAPADALVPIVREARRAFVVQPGGC